MTLAFFGQLQFRILEANRRSNCNSQVVIYATVEVHLVACLGANANGPEEEFNAAAWIEDAVQIRTSELRREITERRRPRRHAKTNESALGEQESANRRIRAELEFRAKHEVRCLQIGTKDGSVVVDAANVLCIALAEIVGALGFERQVWMDVESHSSAHAIQIGS